MFTACTETVSDAKQEAGQPQIYPDYLGVTIPVNIAPLCFNMADENAIASQPEYGRLRQWAYNEDFYFSDHVTAEMLESLYFRNTDNRMAYQYLLAYCMLTGDHERYNRITSKAQ